MGEKESSFASISMNNTMRIWSISDFTLRIKLDGLYLGLERDYFAKITFD